MIEAVKTLWNKITFQDNTKHLDFIRVNDNRIVFNSSPSDEPNMQDIIYALETTKQGTEYSVSCSTDFICTGKIFPTEHKTNPNIGLVVVPYRPFLLSTQYQISDNIEEWAKGSGKSGYIIMHVYPDYCVHSAGDIRRIKTKDWGIDFNVMHPRLLRALPHVITEVLFAGGTVHKSDLEKVLRLQDTVMLNSQVEMVVYGLNKNGTSKSLYPLTLEQRSKGPYSYSSRKNLLAIAKNMRENKPNPETDLVIHT